MEQAKSDSDYHEAPESVPSQQSAQQQHPSSSSTNATGTCPQHQHQEHHHEGGLSPSAVDLSEATQAGQSKNFHRWPSYAIGSTDVSPSIDTSFLFVDQVHSGDDGDAGKARQRRDPINILKLPWHHPFRHHESNKNPYKIPRALFAALLLTTSLALLSAWDAQNHCITDEMDALKELFEDQEDDDSSNSQDNNDQDQQQTDDQTDDVLSESAVLAVKEMCKQMFRHVMLPVGLVTCIGSLLALLILRQHQKTYGDTKTPHGLSIDQSPPCFYSFYLPLLFCSGLILVVWTVGIILVMLRPRSNDTDNPYSSLAAVDSMGRVADNANLYYFSWISEGIAILIFYQLGGALVRQHFHPSLTSPVPKTAENAAIATSSNTLPPPAPATSYFSWRRTASTLSTEQVQGSTIVAPKSAIQNPLIQFPAPPAASQARSMPHQHQTGGGIPINPPPTPHRYHANRVRWFQAFYKLRVRTGMWVAAMLTSLVVVASSAHLFHEVLLPTAQSLYDDDDYLSSEDHHHWWNVIQDNKSYNKVCVILSSHNSNLSQELCSRTFFSLLSGFVAVVLCSTAIVLHILTRQSAAADALYYEACGGVYPELAMHMMANQHHHLPLRTELLLSFVLSLWLGWNAHLVTSVQGPAPRVGNLYYASWICFLLCLRICLGCVEEYFDIQGDDDHHHVPTSTKNRTGKVSASYRAPNDVNASAQNKESGNTHSDDLEHQTSSDIVSTPSVEQKKVKDKIEKERAKRLRRYFFLGTFSTVCAGSALDAAKNQMYALSMADYYMVFAPTIAASLSAILFLLCLSKTAYATITQFWCGGSLSMLTFGIWLGNLILTMHSGDSWAVNGVGEIEMANLYYFSWASIITAGLQMMSYVKEIGPNWEEDYMVVVWAAIGKVCFVILGAAGHIWHTISDHCDLVLIQYTGAITFCSRTVLAMVISSVGMVLGGLVVLTRVVVPTRYFSTRSRAHCEAVISIFLVLLFGVAAAMITGIGGPGQSVGDLYYSTWLAFWVSICIFVSCYDQIKLEEMEAASREKYYHQHQELREMSHDKAVLT